MDFPDVSELAPFAKLNFYQGRKSFWLYADCYDSVGSGQKERRERAKDLFGPLSISRLSFQP